MFYAGDFMTLVAVGLVIWLVLAVLKQGRRIDRLEALLAGRDNATEPATDAESPHEQQAEREGAAAAEGPWADTRPDPEGGDLPPAERPPQPDRPPRAFVFRRDRVAGLGHWIAANWFLAVAALSLVLAGVFLVQYGVENGLLTPFWRVMGALGLGAALIGGGEFIRRRAGDGADSHAAFLPSTFAGAGVVTLFAGVIAARQLYGLIGAETAVAGLVAVAALAVALGWFYGPFLAAIGIIGATLAPFVVGGSGPVPVLFFWFFALLALTGMLIDALRRWAWVSVAALVFPHVGAWLLFAGGGAPLHYAGFGLAVSVFAVLIPPLKWTPAHDGAMISDMVRLRGSARRWPEFPTRIAAGGVAGGVGTATLAALAGPGAVELWLILGALSLIFFDVTIRAHRAPALADLAVLPVLGLLVAIADQAVNRGAVFSGFMQAREPESAAPLDVSALVLLAAGWSALAFWRSLNGRDHPLGWAGLSALIAPATVALIEATWQPVPQISAYGWALHGLGIAALMTAFAGAAARRDGADRSRAALFALGAATMIAFALIVTLSDIALTLALALAALGAALIDRALGMRALALFVQAMAITVGWRLVLYPGLDWAQFAPILQIWLGYGGTIALLSAAWLSLRGLHRPGAAVTLESAVWTLCAVFLSVLIFRALGGSLDSHGGMGLVATVWLSAMAAQLYRMRLGGWMRWVRGGLAICFAVPGFGALVLIGVLFNPILPHGGAVQGPPVLDSLLAAFLLPAMPLLVIAWRMTHLHRWLRGGFGLIGTALAVTYVGFEIRRAWRGDILSVPGTTGPELYSYTVALLVTGAALLFAAFARRSVPMRRLAMAVIALTIAKVFLVDMSGLAGLVRVASFLGLGLSLAGLAWINRRMTEQWGGGEGDDAVEKPT